jgi:hypothetical protein
MERKVRGERYEDRKGEWEGAGREREMEKERERKRERERERACIRYGGGALRGWYMCRHLPRTHTSCYRTHTSFYRIYIRSYRAL